MVICAYAQRRWAQTRAAVESVLSQEPRPAQVLLVIDHNAELAAQARRSLPGVTVLESHETPGLSGARNAGLQSASQPITVFLDDDARARPGWLAALTEPYASPDVVATGGSVHPLWPGQRPQWLPPAFDWVVGCSYAGLPEKIGVVRNPIGASMSMRTQPALDAGGFDTGLGRVGTRPLGCEETELAIRLTASRPGSVVMYVPEAAVDHHVGAERLNLGYFLRRCWHEGLSKALVVRLAGSSTGLARERRHVAAVIPAAFVRDLRRAATGNPDGFMRMCALLGGLASAVAGYLTGRARFATHGEARRPVLPAGRTPSPDPAVTARRGLNLCRRSSSRPGAAGEWSHFLLPAIRPCSR